MGWIFSFLSFVLCGRGDFLYYAISRRLASNMNKIKKKKKIVFSLVWILRLGRGTVPKFEEDKDAGGRVWL